MIKSCLWIVKEGPRLSCFEKFNFFFFFRSSFYLSLRPDASSGSRTPSSQMISSSYLLS